MSLKADAVEAIAALADRDRLPVTQEVNGNHFLLIPKGDAWEKHLVEPPEAGPAPAALHLHTLTGLVDYLTSNIDRLDKARLMIRVASHAQVELFSRIEAEWPEGKAVDADNDAVARWTLAVVEFLPLIGTPAANFQFGQYTDLETINIALQTLFVNTDERAAVLHVLGTIKQEKVETANDDGVSQGVIAAAGVISVALARVPNPVTLQPYRTFREVEQPPSSFVLRLRQGQSGGLPTAALYEADGGAWKLEAIRRVRDFLADKIKDVAILA